MVDLEVVEYSTSHSTWDGHYLLYS